MKSGQRLWAREELILAFDLYCKLPFGRMHGRNSEILDLANLIGRTPGAVAYKLLNFASFDETLQARGIKGAANASKLDREIWEEFSRDWNKLFNESKKIWVTLKGSEVLQSLHDEEYELVQEGKIRESLVEVRVNQSIFRKVILASYNSTCCFTRLQDPQLLVACHIRPWAIDAKNRLNPKNGLAMNGLHDKAFESGLVSITPEYRILISSQLKKQSSQAVHDYFLKYEGKEIILPSKFPPDRDFLKYHNDERFKA